MRKDWFRAGARIGFGQEPAADVAADVVADDDDGVEPEEIDIPLPGAKDVNDIGDGVVEAADDEQRDAEENRD